MGRFSETTMHCNYDALLQFIISIPINVKLSRINSKCGKSRLCLNPRWTCNTVYKTSTIAAIRNVISTICASYRQSECHKIPPLPVDRILRFG